LGTILCNTPPGQKHTPKQKQKKQGEKKKKKTTQEPLGNVVGRGGGWGNKTAAQQGNGFSTVERIQNASHGWWVATSPAGVEAPNGVGGQQNSPLGVGGE